MPATLSSIARVLRLRRVVLRTYDQVRSKDPRQTTGPTGPDPKVVNGMYVTRFMPDFRFQIWHF